MAPKRILYQNMNSDQKERAEKWADKWGKPVEECVMADIGDGIIINNIDENDTDQEREDRNIVALGYVKRAGDITDAIRAEYRADIARCKKDYKPVRLK